MKTQSLLDIGQRLKSTVFEEAAPIDLREFTDIHINDQHPHISLIFPGPRLPDNNDIEVVIKFLEKCRTFTREDFMFSYEGFSFRGHRENHGIDGTWYRLRRLPQVAPSLDTLPSTPPAWLPKLLLDPNLRQGGLLYFVGSPAQGKTTTASATLVSRLKKFGGYAQTIEDPPEMPLNGWHGAGYCSQTWCGSETQDSWSDSIKGALRSMPASTASMLYIGEVRDADCAQTMLRAASNGFLVLATGFATDVVSGLQALCKIAGDNESTHQMLANSLRMTMHLQIISGDLKAVPLVSTSTSSSVANRIRKNDFQNLQNNINEQSKIITMGQDLSFLGT